MTEGRRGPRGLTQGQRSLAAVLIGFIGYRVLIGPQGLTAAIAVGVLAAAATWVLTGALQKPKD